MKLKFTPLLFLLLLPILSFAQQKPIKVGLKAMPEFTQIMGTFIGGESRFTFSGGVQFVYPLSSRVSLEEGLSHTAIAS